jgi:hypothetical protein
MWEPQHLTTLWASTACYRDSFTLLVDGMTDGQMSLILRQTVASVVGIVVVSMFVQNKTHRILYIVEVQIFTNLLSVREGDVYFYVNH